MKNLSTRFTVVSRAKGGSAIDKASYISREELFSEYDGTMHRPDKTSYYFSYSVHPYISNKLGITQLMAGGGIIAIGTPLIPLLSTLF